MNTANTTRVLAIGIDAAEATFVRQLIDENRAAGIGFVVANRLLAQRALSRKRWQRHRLADVHDRRRPHVHGMYSEMELASGDDELEPLPWAPTDTFWKPLAQREVPIGIFDVPFALPVGVSNGFEVCEWWAHDSTGAGLQGGPPEVRQLVTHSPAHPLSANRFADTTPDSQRNLKELTAACVEGCDCGARWRRA
mgnify:CR=1 FL=1